MKLCKKKKNLKYEHSVSGFSFEFGERGQSCIKCYPVGSGGMSFKKNVRVTETDTDAICEPIGVFF